MMYHLGIILGAVMMVKMDYAEYGLGKTGEGNEGCVEASPKLIRDH